MEESKKEITNSFVVKYICDHWKNYTYHQRYLDALASILAVQKPCAAIAYFSQTKKFYLSYNYSIDQSHCEKPQHVAKKIEIIQKWLNYKGEAKQLQIESLLFLYIAYNTDFINKLEIDYRIFNPNTQDQYTLSMEDIEFDAAKIKVILKDQASLIKQKEVDKSKLEEKIRSKLGSLAESIESVNELKPLDPEKNNSNKRKKYHRRGYI